MKSLSRILVKLIVVSALVMCMSLAAFAAQAGYVANFAVALPKNQGDIEVGTIARENDSNTWHYFTITIRDLQTGNAVRAWTENSWGANLSSPDNFAYIKTQSIDYNIVPDAGTNVTLNLDNPAKSNYTNSVLGSWTPN